MRNLFFRENVINVYIENNNKYLVLIFFIEEIFYAFFCNFYTVKNFAVNCSDTRPFLQKTGF